MTLGLYSQGNLTRREFVEQRVAAAEPEQQEFLYRLLSPTSADDPRPLWVTASQRVQQERDEQLYRQFAESFGIARATHVTVKEDVDEIDRAWMATSVGSSAVAPEGDPTKPLFDNIDEAWIQLSTG